MSDIDANTCVLALIRFWCELAGPWRCPEFAWYDSQERIRKDVVRVIRPGDVDKART